MVHRAAWINGKGEALQVGDAETPAPAAGEVLVKVQVIALSPIDPKQQKLAIHPYPYPQILGTSYAGTVEAIGPGVTDFQTGDHIATLRPEDKTGDPRYGAFQQYALASTASSSKLFSNTSLEAGATTILNLRTISAALTLGLGLRRPDLTGSVSPTDESVLVYGGSSASGGLATSYAISAGYRVVTTSSPKNWDIVKSLGSSTIIDHTQASEEVLQSLKQNGPYHATLDTIGLPSVTKVLTRYLAGVGGGRYVTLVPLLPGSGPVPENVDRHFESWGYVFDRPEHHEIRRWFHDELLPRGLDRGSLTATKAEWVHGGLEKVQEALDKLARDEVSGKKLVLDPWE